MRARLILGVIGAAVAALGLAASAAAVDTRTPITEPLFNPCTQEPLVAQGFIHITSDFTVGTDGSLHDRYHLNMEGMTAKTVTGVKYVVQEEWNVGTNADEDHSTTHHIFKQHYVRTREDGTFVLGDDFYVYFKLHLTTNANGAPVVRMESEEEPCQ
jgi:hypothetical protein